MTAKTPPGGSGENDYGQLSHSTSSTSDASSKTTADIDKLKDEITRLYSPSRWTKRMSPDDVINAHINIVTSGESPIISYVRVSSILENM